MNLEKETDDKKVNLPVKSTGSFAFNFNKEPVSWLSKIKNGIKKSSNILLFGTGILTGYFLYHNSFLTPVLNVLHFLLQYGFLGASMIITTSALLKMKEKSENEGQKEEQFKYIKKSLLISFALLTTSLLISL